MRIAVLIVAAGRGQRAASVGRPKQYAELNGQSVLQHALDAFESHAAVTDSLVVIHHDDRDLYADAVGKAPTGIVRHPPVIGGATRQQSVAKGLAALATVITDSDAIVLIHDAARPLVDHDTIDRVLAATRPGQGAIAAIPVADTLKKSAGKISTGEQTSDHTKQIDSTVARDGLWQAQTPQAFLLTDILDLHRKAASAPSQATDDAAIAEAAGYPVVLVEGDSLNRKITTAQDLRIAESILKAIPMAGDDVEMFETRTASGFDVHRFTDGDHVWLGGVRIPHEAKLEGHSDADVVLHALTDALLGCIGDGDIGQHFPPSDPQWKDAASIRFLEDAFARVTKRGGKIVNVDVTVLAEAPKIGPHRAAMQSTIGAALGLSNDRVGIKATTMEGLGFIGRREGMCAMATATVRLPVQRDD